MNTVRKPQSIRRGMTRMTATALIAGTAQFSYGRDISNWKCGDNYRWTVDINPFQWKETWKECGESVAQQPKEITPTATDELRTIFNGLVTKWRKETGGSSLVMRRYAHSAYQSILVLGGKEPMVIDLILRELQERPDMWFEALRRLTNENPAKDAKSFEESRQAWIQWGKDRQS